MFEIKIRISIGRKREAVPEPEGEWHPTPDTAPTPMEVWVDPEVALGQRDAGVGFRSASGYRQDGMLHRNLSRSALTGRPLREQRG